MLRGARLSTSGKTSDPPPEGFGNSTVIKTAGTIYPGLIELHNHLSYNILPMWMVPEQFEESAQWRRVKYKGVTTGPLDVLGGLDGYLQAIVGYAECKLLVSEQCGGAVLLKRLDQQGIINLDVG